MTPREAVERGLALFGSELGLPLGLDGDNACRLDFNEGLSCTLELGPDDDSLFLYGELIPLPGDGHEKLLREALGLNLYGLETGGGAIALDTEANALMLCLHLPPAMLAPEQTRDLIGDFVLRLDHLREHLRELEEGTGRQPSSQDPYTRGITPNRLA